jgi:hypothetical protein
LDASDWLSAAIRRLRRFVHRWKRASVYWRALSEQDRQSAMAIARYEGVCAQSRRWRFVPRPDTRMLPLSARHELRTAVMPVIDPAVAARHRRFEALCRLLDRVAAQSPAAIDPLRSEPALNVQALLMKRMFRRVLDVTLGSWQLRVIRQYGSVALAMRDLLAISGFSRRAPDFTPITLDLESFVKFATLRHRRRQLMAEGEALAAERIEAVDFWARAREAGRDRAWRRRDRDQQMAWAAVRPGIHHGFHAQVWQAEADGDREEQSLCAIRLAHDVFSAWMARAIDLAVRLLEADPALAESDASVQTFNATITGLTEHLSAALAQLEKSPTQGVEHEQRNEPDAHRRGGRRHVDEQRRQSVDAHP